MVTQIEIPNELTESLVRQDWTADYINKIANHPNVRPFIGMPEIGELDFEQISHRAFFLVTDHGGFIFDRIDPGYYCLHTMFLPEGRGKHVARAAQAAAFWMFCRTDATEIVTYSPKDRPLTRPPRSMGWRNWFEGKQYNAYRLSLMDWASNAPELSEWGEWFHTVLKQAKKEQNSEIPAHEDDPANDRFSGMAAAMAYYGQPFKAVYYYNRWAQVAGYDLVLLESEDPVRINAMDAIWTVKSTEVEIETCQQQLQ